MPSLAWPLFILGLLPQLPCLCGIRQRQVNLLRVAIPHDIQLDFRARRILAHDHLQIATGFHATAIDSGDHIAGLQACVARGELGVTEAISAPLLLVRLKNCALSGVTSFKPTPRYP